jgi:S-adenosylmethionine decarboxylase proenzyme
MKTLGRHILIEYYDCAPGVLDDLQFIENSMKEAAVRSGSTIVDSIFQRFVPHGISGVVVIAESHFAIHTWPEYGYAAVDLFTCGKNVNPWVAYQTLHEAFGAAEAETREIQRGDSRVFGNGASHKPALGSDSAH